MLAGVADRENRRPEVLVGRIVGGDGFPLVGKAKVMAAQRGDRRVESISWRPTTLPTEGNSNPDNFLLMRSKVMTGQAIVDDLFIAVAAPPKILFEASLKDLSHHDVNTRKQVCRCLIH
jgi:hypothetical protein